MKNYKITFKELFDYLDNNIKYASIYLIKDQLVKIFRYDWSCDNEIKNENTYNTHDKFTINIDTELNGKEYVNQNLIVTFSRNSTNVQVLISKKLTCFSNHQAVTYSNDAVLTFIYEYDDNIPNIKLIHDLYFTDIIHLILTGDYKYSKKIEPNKE